MSLNQDGTRDDVPNSALHFVQIKHAESDQISLFLAEIVRKKSSGFSIVSFHNRFVNDTVRRGAKSHRLSVL